MSHARKQIQTERPKSKLEPHRAAILAAVAEGLPLSAIRSALAEHYQMTVSYTGLREWLHRQPEYRKTTKGGAQKPMTKAEQARWDKLANRDPNEPLTLTRKK